jgi:NADH dehydrogenase FAD-containing subunit
VSKRTPILAIVGGGFAGLSVAKGLRKSPVEIVLIGQANHHPFQSLLYQVATSVLTTGQIVVPIHGILRGHKNTRIILGEVTEVDKEQKVSAKRKASVEGLLGMGWARGRGTAEESLGTVASSSRTFDR